jgi:hypothetical protein
MSAPCCTQPCRELGILRHGACTSTSMHMLYTHVRLSFGDVSRGLFRSEMNTAEMHRTYVCPVGCDSLSCAVHTAFVCCVLCTSACVCRCIYSIISNHLTSVCIVHAYASPTTEKSQRSDARAKRCSCELFQGVLSFASSVSVVRAHKPCERSAVQRLQSLLYMYIATITAITTPYFYYHCCYYYYVLLLLQLY